MILMMRNNYDFLDVPFSVADVDDDDSLSFS
jgi:hypothetical protein